MGLLEHVFILSILFCGILRSFPYPYPYPLWIIYTADTATVIVSYHAIPFQFHRIDNSPFEFEMGLNI